MSLFKRLSTSIYAQIDEMVGEIENHDALIKAAINEQKKKLVAAKIQLKSLKSKQVSVQEKINELNTQANQWSQRAIKSADEDEQQALVCMQRREECLQHIEQLKSSLASYHDTIHTMSADIQACEKELQSMIQKHELMRARQTTADAKSSVSEHTDHTLAELDNSFQRWELKLSHSELHSDFQETTDEFEESFLEEERQADLKEKLSKLIDADQGEQA